MERAHRWLVGISVVAALASMMAAGLLWLLLTQPVALVEAFGRGF